MASSDMTLEVKLTDEFVEVIQQAQVDFKRMHTELTDELKKLITEEVKRQLDERDEQRIQRLRLTMSLPQLENE